jgi:hypothetical protein
MYVEQQAIKEPRYLEQQEQSYMIHINLTSKYKAKL